MEKAKCGVVRDLLSSYQEGITSVATTEMIEEHLRECQECFDYMEEQMWEKEQKTEEEIARGKKFQDKMISYRYGILGFFVGLCLPVLFILLRFLFGMIQNYIMFWFFAT